MPTREKTSDIVAIVGGGRIGEAIAGGLLAADASALERVVIAEPVEARREELFDRWGVRCVESAELAVAGADTVVLALKPEIIERVASAIAPQLSDTLVISVAAGISCARLEAALGPHVPVVRVMPNAPALVGEGVSVVSPGVEAREVHVSRALEMFSSLGEVVVLEERHQDIATALSGSGPAYVALFVDALARAGVRHGLPREVSERLALRTLAGTVRLIEVTGERPERIVDTIASPGGTTIAAIEVLESYGMRAAVAACVGAAVSRAKELGS